MYCWCFPLMFFDIGAIISILGGALPPNPELT